MTSNSEKIIVVVVTYNRKDLLKKNIRSLLDQNRMPDAVIVVDNASIDGTGKMLRKEFSEHSFLTYLNLDQNLGGAGGFHYGTKLAVEKGADWVCLMDDDCVLHPDCLRQMMKHVDNRNNIYSPIIISIEDKKTALWGIKAQVNSGNHNIATLPFNGFLIHRETINAIGYPDKDFFIYGDDADYNFRVKASGREVILVTGSIIYHPLKNTLQGMNIIKLFLNQLWVYYKLRNGIVVFKRYGYFSVKQFILLFASLGFYFLTFNFRFIGLWIAGLKDGLKNNVYVRDFDT
ncbi:glycosyltransferase family 2 protein [Thermodesulfobacteriota bacterium]